MAKRADAYGMDAMTVDGQDVEAVFETARKALKHARDGKGGPVFVVADCVRLSAATSATPGLPPQGGDPRAAQVPRSDRRPCAPASISPTRSSRRWTTRTAPIAELG